jgi:hypothetical protein
MRVHETKKRPHRLLVHGVNTLPAVCLHINEMAEFEAFEVVGDGRLLQAALFRQLRNIQWFLEEKKHEFYSSGIAQCLYELLMGGR